MRIKRLILSLAGVTLALSTHDMALAQSFARAKPSSDNGAGYRGLLFALPLTLTAENVGRLEYNLSGHASLGVEANFQRSYDRISEEEQLETGESLRTDARGAAIMISRYSDGARMAGFYWGLGLGYRQMNADWAIRPDDDDKQVDYSLVDDSQRLNHAASLKGGTAHMRIGYRYVGTDWPLSIGAYLGVRHFQSTVSDTDLKPNDKRRQEGVTYANLTDKEKDRLKHRFATFPEPGIEFGIVF